MAQEQEVVLCEVGDVDESTPGYKAPAQVSLDEIKQLDADDESLVKYKNQLLGGDADVKPIFPDNPATVIVKSMSLVVKDRPDITLDLTGDISRLKDNKIIIKEGSEHRLRINFYVQKEIVSGLRYIQKVTRNGITVDSDKHMIGSYSPANKEHSYLSPMDEAPGGMLARGTYSVQSRFIDDDKKDILAWNWAFTIKKNWE